MKYLVLMLAVVLTLGSCAMKRNGSDSQSGSISDNTTWRIVELSGKTVANKVNDVVPQLIFDNEAKRYSVATGCNNISGSFTLTKNSISFGPGMSTMMFCNDMSVEDGFKAIMDKVNAYEVKGSELILKDKSTVLAKLVKYDVATTLVGTSWELDYLAAEGGSFNDLFGNAKPTLTFEKDGKVFGNASCNRFNSTFTVDGNKISFANAITTRMTCPTIKGEQAFLETLSKVNVYSQHGNTLTLIIGDIAVMRFQKK